MPLFQFLFGLLLALGIGYFGYRRGSLALSGAVGAVILGTLIVGVGGWAWGVLLITFFVTSSALSHFKESRKTALAEKFSKGSRRDLSQVLANGGVGAVCVVGNLVWPSPLWWAAYIGAMATVNADTWATELGVLSTNPPRLITNGKVVETGTSGGLTLAGTRAALAGAALIGAMAAVVSWNLAQPLTAQLAAFITITLIGALAGLLGSLFDSFLGATVQAIYRCDQCQKDTERYPTHTCGAATRLIRGWPWLDNDWVNFVSSVVGAALAAAAYALWVIG